MPNPSQIIIPFNICICGDPACQIPYGCCHCGCGEQTSVAKKDDARRIHIKGMPVRFVVGHINRNRKIPVILDALPFLYEGDLCRHIVLTQGQVTIVDADNFDWLNQWNWFSQFDKTINSFYARRNSTPDPISGKRHTIHMHRVILGMSSNDSRDGDHKNRNTLDNRRNNLRPANKSENAQNASRRKDNSSGIRGVSWSKETQKWTASISCNGKRLFLGRFLTIDEAKAAYESAALRLHEEFANFT